MNYSKSTSELLKQFHEILNVYIPRERRFMAKTRNNQSWLELYHGDAENNSQEKMDGIYNKLIVLTDSEIFPANILVVFTIHLFSKDLVYTKI